MEEDFKLVGNDGLFQEYLKIGQILSNTFQTIHEMFSSPVWPHNHICCCLPPGPALLNNWLKIRLDAQKFV